MTLIDNARWKRTTVVVVLPAVVSCAALAACGSSDEASPPPQTLEDAGGGSLFDVVSPEDAAPDAPGIGDAAIDRRPPREAGSGPAPSTVHDVWAGTEVTCARVETEGTTTTECWGNNRFGQLGRGEVSAINGEAFTPQPIQSDLAEDFVKIAAGQPVCARSSDKSLRCWAQSFASGVPITSSPPAEPLLTNVEDIAIGGTVACALLSGGRVTCWGRNSSGQLGLGYRDSVVHATPEEIPDFTAEQLSVGQDHVCVLKEGEVWCWGSNSSGALASLVPRFQNSLSPGRIPNVSGIARVVAGRGFTCALATDKTVWCWGDIPQASNNFGTPMHMLEVGYDENDPEPDRLLTEVEELAGSDGICARLTSGAVKCLGTNGAFVGYPDHTHYRQTRRFTTVLGIDDATRIVAGFNHVCAIVEGGALRCWGDNAQGQLGIDPKIKDRSGLPVLVGF